ncbi:MAG: methyltransferase domain-containing protein [Alphaproteobacteria bacterium]|nr:methyltransferase domain-containing protein [Alphaproteobacteria bacterium]
MPGVLHGHRHDTCRFCGSGDLKRYLDLGEQPPSNSFLRPEEVAAEQRFPLDVYLCRTCGLSQLGYVVSAQDIFDDYVYLSSTSRALVAHFQALIDSVIGEFQMPAQPRVVDIGCNDGIMLDRYPASYVRIGVEPSSAGEIAAAKGHHVLKSFFDPLVAQAIVERFGAANVVTMTNVFAHIDAILPVVEGLQRLLRQDGIVIIEFPYIIDTVDQVLFDTIYHEHLSYLSVTPTQALFSRYGMRCIQARRAAIGASGPAVQLFICHDAAPYAGDGSVEALVEFEKNWGLSDMAPYATFAQAVGDRTQQLRSLVQDLRSAGKRIAGFAAPAKGNTLLNTAGLTAQEITAISENNEWKIGRLAPGSHIPVVSEQEFMDGKFDYALLLAWNYLDFFLERSEYIKGGGKFIVPLPEPRILPA